MRAASLLLLLIYSISAKAFTWPDWVYQANCQADHFCAVGVGESETLAKKFAFDDLSQQLQASVNSQSLVAIKKSGDKTSSSLSQKIHVTTQSIPLNLVSVAEKAFHNNQTALLITLSKQQFYNNLSTRIETFFNNISTAEQLSQQPLWQQRVWSIKQHAKQANIENQLSLLTALSSEKTYASGLWQQFKHWQQLTSTYKNKAIIEVQAPSDLQNINASINQYLTGGAGTIYWLQPSLKTRSAKKSGQHIVQALLSLELLESTPPYRTVFTNLIKTQQSSTSLKSAKQKAIKAIAQLIETTKGQILFNKEDQHRTKEYQ